MNKGVTFQPHNVQCSNRPPLKSSMENVSVLLAFYTKRHKPLMADLMSVLVATFPFCIRNKSLHQKEHGKSICLSQDTDCKIPTEEQWKPELTALFQVHTILGGSWQSPLKRIICIMQGSARGFFRGTKTYFCTCPNHSLIGSVEWRWEQGLVWAGNMPGTPLCEIYLISFCVQQTQQNDSFYSGFPLV